ncbi:TIGR02117 family protein [Argonema galeatum]|uniref:TIGR02117 family protein n=1 Tax=Argonema galeatum TaxID=2942762 RepID=UPI002011E158|nr:TIGR02117 family protein [Argonema galeatum]MCL1467005.1 TIGR02117 family protein [Argonema galeatum A003/A1]
MRYLKKICRYLVFSTLSILTVLTIGYFTPTKWCNSSQSNCHLTICVSDTGIHTNIVVPVKNDIFDWKIYLKIDDIKNNSETNYNYLSFGWGDRAFYLTTPTLADLNLMTTFNALFLPTPSVMDVQWYQVIPNHIERRCVGVSQTDYLNLMKFINDSFQLDDRGRKIRISQGHSSHSSFYEAKGSYSILRNCNSWTAEGLRKANVNTPLWPGLSSGIMLHLKNSCECSQ